MTGSGIPKDKGRRRVEGLVLDYERRWLDFLKRTADYMIQRNARRTVCTILTPKVRPGEL